MNWIAIAKIVIELLPTLIEAVQAIETALPQSGQGKEKLALVRGVLEAAYNAGGTALGSFEAVWPALQGAVSAVVSTLNATGVFAKRD